jgi:hypothetical protein
LASAYFKHTLSHGLPCVIIYTYQKTAD